MIFNTHYPYIGGGGGGVPVFEYTGNYEYIDDGGGNWRIKFLTSGVFKPLKKLKIDAFLVGGGAAGCFDTRGAQGGAGGYTRTVKNIELSANTEYQVVVGAGGTFVYRTTSNGGSIGNGGGSSSAFGFSANGAGANTYVLKLAVGSGGSGGAYVNTSGTKVNGGSDGSNGGNGSTGQGTTTREFGEPGGDLYSGGGAAYYNSTYNASNGEGGGGKYVNSPQPGETNKGGGGCGTGTAAASGSSSGGSGIVIIRNAR